MKIQIEKKELCCCNNFFVYFLAHLCFCLHIYLKKMFQLKRIIKPCLLRSIYRSYVSSININVDKIKVIKIRPDEFEEHSKNLIKVEMIDGEKNLIKLENHTRITQNDDKFTLECLEDHDADKMKDMSLIIDLPISSCNDIEIKVSAVKGDDDDFFVSALIAHNNE